VADLCEGMKGQRLARGWWEEEPFRGQARTRTYYGGHELGRDLFLQKVIPVDFLQKKNELNNFNQSRRR